MCKGIQLGDRIHTCAKESNGVSNPYVCKGIQRGIESMHVQRNPKGDLIHACAKESKGGSNPYVSKGGSNPYVSKWGSNPYVSKGKRDIVPTCPKERGIESIRVQTNPKADRIHTCPKERRIESIRVQRNQNGGSNRYVCNGVQMGDRIPTCAKESARGIESIRVQRHPKGDQSVMRRARN